MGLLPKCPWWLAFGLLLAGCAGEDRRFGNNNWPRPPDFEQPIDNIPKFLKVAGSWGKSPALSLKDLGSSRMAMLRGEAQVTLSPQVAGLAKALEFGHAETVTWLAPQSSGCKPSQVSIRKTALDPLTLELTVWGWDRAGSGSGSGSDCELLLNRTRGETVQIRLTNTAVRVSEPVPELLIEITP